MSEVTEAAGVNEQSCPVQEAMERVLDLLVRSVKDRGDWARLPENHPDRQWRGTDGDNIERYAESLKQLAKAYEW